MRDWETDKIRKLLSSPSFDRFTVIGNDMAGILMRKTKLVQKQARVHRHDDLREQQDSDV